MTDAEILSLVQQVSPDLGKYLRRAHRSGLVGAQALADAQARMNEAKANNRQQTIEDRSVRGESGSIFPGYRYTADGTLGAAKTASIGGGVIIPTHPRNMISQADAYLKHPKYHEYYIRNHSRSYPMPLAATDGIANKTLPVTATVSEALTVPPGYQCIIVPTPDYPSGAPYLRAMGPQTAPTRALTIDEGKWFGGYSPQTLLGPAPQAGLVDDRALQFKSGCTEISVAVAYDNSCTVGFLDPYTTLQYGKSLGLMQQGAPVTAPVSVHSNQYRDWVYTTDVDMTTAVNFDSFMALAVRQNLVGSSKQSGISFKQLLRPHAHTFNPAVNGTGLGAPLLQDIGWPSNTPLPTVSETYVQKLGIFAQGMYLIDNSNGSSAVSVEVAMDMHYRVRVDNQAPAVYDMADDRSTPKHSIEFIPTSVMAPSKREAAEASHAVNGTTKAVPSNIVPAASAVQGSTSGWASVTSQIPIFGGNITKAGKGLERAFTRGGDVGELIGGLSDFATGTLGGLESAMNLFS